MARFLGRDGRRRKCDARQGRFTALMPSVGQIMRKLTLFALSGIVVTTFLHAGAAPVQPPPALLDLNEAERARIVAALPAVPRRAPPGSLHSR